MWEWMVARVAGVWGYVAAATAAGAVLLAALAGARKSGRTEEQNAQLRKTMADAQVRADVDREVSGADLADVRKQLREKFSRGE